MKSLPTFRREWTLLIILLLTCYGMSLMSPNFAEPDNLLKLTRHIIEAGIIACGMTLIIMTGGIDLSVGSVLALASITLGYIYKATNMPVAIFACLAVGLLCGMFNGVLVTLIKLPPLVVTLATMALFRGIAMVISKAQPVSQFPEWFTAIGQSGIAIDAGKYGAVIPNQLFIWIFITVVFAVIAHRMPLGRYATAIGDNERAAQFAALPVGRIKFWIYAVTGLLAGFASLIFTSRVNTAKADAGIGLELDVIVAVVLGGTAITGGRGTVIGSFLGILILGVLRNGLKLGGVQSVWVELLAGALLIVTAVVNQRLLERAARRKAPAVPTAPATPAGAS